MVAEGRKLVGLDCGPSVRGKANGKWLRNRVSEPPDLNRRIGTLSKLSMDSGDAVVKIKGDWKVA